MPLFAQAFVLFITLFLMLVGLIFTVLPPIPGILVIWAAALIYAALLGWSALGWWAFGMMTMLMILGIVADFLGGQFGAKIGGASCLAVAIGTALGLLLGLIGSIVGTPLVGCLAGLGGTLGGIVLVERHRYQDWRTAVGAVKGYLAGNVAGIAARFTAGVLMIVVFLARVYFWG